MTHPEPSRGVDYHSLPPPYLPDAQGWAWEAAKLLIAKPVDLAIGEILQFTGRAAGADRAWLFRYNSGMTHFSNTHEWSRAGIRCFVDDLQDTPVTMISWLQRSLVQPRAVMIHHIPALPRAAAALRAEFVRQRNASVLSVPIPDPVEAGRLAACIGFDAVEQPVRWPEQTAHSLAACGNLIALAWQRSADSAAGRSADPAEPPPVYLHCGSQIRAVPLAEIVGITAERDYTRVHLLDGSTALELRPLKTWLSLLPRPSFQQIHRGAVVQLSHVRSLERLPGGRWRVQLADAKEPWNVSRAFRADLRSRLAI